MKTPLRLAALAALLSLAACATEGAGSGPYAAAFERLSEDCRQRGGILVPISSAMNGEPERDYVCRIAGGPSPRVR